MKIGAHYRCSIPSTECIRLLRESAGGAEWYRHFKFGFDGSDKTLVREDGSFLLGIITGSIQPDGDSSIIKARLIAAFWMTIPILFWPIIFLMFGVGLLFPATKFVVVVYLVALGLLLVVQLSVASKPFEKLRMVLPPEKERGFEVISADDSQLKLQS